MALMTMPHAAAGYAAKRRHRTLARFYVPSEVWCGVLAVASSVIGLELDLAWHRSVGRDTFWTFPHILIQFCAVLTAAVCGYLVLASTYGNWRMRARAVHVFGLRAPLGCLLAAWGGLAMLVSAPFDNWWHTAYGLDVQILSPPHVLLFLGLRCISFGFLVLVAGAMNRSALEDHARFRQLQALFLLIGGFILSGQMLLITMATSQSMLHTPSAYRAIVLATAFLLPMLGWASQHRWAATIATAIYMALRLAEVLLFPLVPATPKLGPVLNPVNHLVPGQFPILLIVPAIALDLLWQRSQKLKPWLVATISGPVFMGAIVGAEWPFAGFLMSGRSENRFFDTTDFDYSVPASDRVRHFVLGQSSGQLWHGLLVATMLACAATWVGIRLGQWLRSVQR